MSCTGDLSNPCVWELFAQLPAVVFVALVAVSSLPLPLPRFLARIRAPFLPTLTLAEAEEFERHAAVEPEPPPHPVVDSAPRWRTALFASLTLLELVAWLFLGVVHAIVRAISATHASLFTSLPFLTALTWLYALFRVLHRPPVTPPFDLFILYILHLLGGVVILGAQLYISATSATPLPPNAVLAAEGVHLGLVLALLALITTLPLNLPSAHVDFDKIVSDRCADLSITHRA